KQDLKRLEKRVEQLNAELAKARGNVVLLDAANIPAAQERIRELDRERAGLERELRESRPPAAKDVNAVALEVLNDLSPLAYCCRSLTQPQYVTEVGQRAVDNGDGTVTYGSLEQVAPQAVRRFLGHASHIVCHTERRAGKPSVKYVAQRGG